MKKIYYLIILALLVMCYSCKDDDDPSPATHSVVVQLAYPVGNNQKLDKDVKIELKGGTSIYEAFTDATAKATFSVPVGVYEASTSFKRLENSKYTIFNGVKSSITVTDSWNVQDVQQLELTQKDTKSAQIVIKEIYTGGVPRDDGSGTFTYDRYAILYNNSEEVASLENMALAMTMPYNSSGSNNYYVGGTLSYLTQGWIPAGQAIWYFQQNVSIDPGKQIVIAFANAVNNTVTYSQSINFDNADYYCTYDPEVYTHPLTYPSPAASIPTSHYLKAVSYGAGTAWAISQLSPAFYIFTTEGTTPKGFANDVSKNDLYGGNSILVSKKVDTKWIVDGVEVFSTSSDRNQKRLTPQVDAGYVYYTNKKGYSIYRNVDLEATKAILGNEAKLIYRYQHGTAGGEVNGTTDPSDVDAEASIKNGARIIYQDTDNSSIDFHQRSRASLRN